MSASTPRAGVTVSVARTLAFTLLYVATTLAGRMTVMDGTNLSLVWPAAGVAVVWFCAQRRARWRWLDVLALTAVTITVNMITGAPAVLAAAFVAANIVQVVVFLRLFARLCPRLWGAGGTEQLTRLADLWRLLAAAFVSTACGATLGPTAVWLLSGAYSWPATAVWMTRNTVSVVLVGAVGLRIGCLIACRTDRRPLPIAAWAALRTVGSRLTGWRLLEYVTLVGVSVVAYAVGFAVNRGLPLAFLLLAVTVWAALRLATTFVVLHDLAVGCAAVLFTLHGNGPFAEIGSNAARALVAQLFVGMVAIVGLSLALSRDERTLLMHRLVASEREATHQARLMTAIVESMHDGLAVIAVDGCVVVRNPAAAALLDGHTTPGRRMGDAAHPQLFHPDGSPVRPGDMAYARALADDETHQMDLIVRGLDAPGGRTVSVTATALPEDAAHARSAVVLFHDVTAERHHRDELATFAGVVAHDLLNPVATIDGWSEALAQTLDEHPDHPAHRDATDSVARIRRATSRMSDLINDLLAYTTARDAELRPTDTDLHALVTEIAIARTDAALAAGAPVPRFTLGDLTPVHADPVLLRQLLDNLISNAVKYTAPGVTPRITVTTRTDRDVVAVDITDNGIGIPHGHHHAIFDNFHRAHSGAEYAGTGLGLAICQRIVARHGGTIAATDNPSGAGTRFTLTLPAATTIAAAVVIS